MRSTRHDLSDVRAILLTHRQPDHIGSLAELKRRTGADAVAHRADIPVITGDEPLPLHRLMMRLSAPFMKPDTAPVDVTLNGDGPTGIPGIRAVHTPGHTSFLLHRDGGVLFAGDAASKIFGRDRPLSRSAVGPPPGIGRGSRRL